MLRGFLNRRATFALFLVAGAVAGTISWVSGQSQNFEVFRAAARALLAGNDLYAKNAADYFKYSPTFALLFVPFTWGPAGLLAALWSMVNFGVAAWGLDAIMDGDCRRKRTATLLALAGVVVATDGDQSNLLVVGAVLLAFVAYEKGRVDVAAHLLAAAALVKVFPLAIAGLALLLPKGRLVRAACSLAAALLVWIALPLLVLTPEQLAEQYASWGRLLGRDHDNHGWSAMSLLQDGFGLRWSTAHLQILGATLQAVPLAMGVRLGTSRAWRRTLLCSLLCFSVLFNHRAEYATFAISAVGVGVWYASAPATKSPFRPALLLFVVLAILAPGPFLTRANPDARGIDAFFAAHRLFHPLRVVPLLVVWAVMQHELLSRFFEVNVRVRRPASLPVGYETLSGGADNAP